MYTKIAEYDNGNVHVTRFSDGTVIRFSEDNEFNFAYPENMDIKICNRCDMNCAWCHEGSSSEGKLGDILDAKWIDTIHPFTEVALGGGNILEHPDLISFLKILKDKNVYANITLNQEHFMKNLLFLEALTAEGYIHGIGVSLTAPTADLFKSLEKFPNAVIHVIAGVLTEETLKELMKHGKDLKILILGYKKLRRGEEYYNNSKEVNNKNIDYNINMLEQQLLSMFKNFNVISFDCLALDQLHVKKYVSKDTWNWLYQGEDGTMTFYIDIVNNKFAKNSIAPPHERYPMLNSVDEMFSYIKKVNHIVTKKTKDITREEAIRVLRRPLEMTGTPSEIIQAHNMAITALENEKWKNPEKDLPNNLELVNVLITGSINGIKHEKFPFVATFSTYEGWTLKNIPRHSTDNWAIIAWKPLSLEDV